MFNKIKRLGAAAVALALSATAFAETPIIEFHTTLYDNAEVENAFHFVIGATEDIYLDVDCGYGLTELEVSKAYFDLETGEIVGSTFTGSVNAEGIVRVYGDASKIDYLDLNGVYIDRLDISALTNLAILDISYNDIVALDLTPQTQLQALYADANPFSEKPLIVGKNKPYLSLLSLNVVENIDSSFNFSDYPALISAVSFSSPSLTKADVSGCPLLKQFSIDISNVETLDVTNNPELVILNIAGTKITEIDLSKNPKLSEFYCGHTSAVNEEYKMKNLDFSKNTQLVRLGVQGNDLTEIDVSMLPMLMSLLVQDNKLTSIDISNNPNIVTLDIMNNNIPMGDIPAPSDMFYEYYYRQNPYKTASAHAVGTSIDFSKQVLREGSATIATLYSINRENPGVSTLLEDSYYSWDAEKGLLELKQACADSVYVSFYNEALPDAAFMSSRFMIKEADQIGKPSASVVITPSIITTKPAIGVGISGASPEHPVNFYVDFGDGNLQTFTATSEDIPAEVNVTGTRRGALTIYVDDDTYVTALSANKQRLSSVDISQAPGLAYLSLTECTLSEIDMSWNTLLSYLDLSGNSLTELSLNGANGSQYKNRLITVIAANNKLETFDFENGTFVNLDLSNNNYSEFSLLKMSNLVNVNLSGNKLETIDLRDCEALQVADFSNNNLTEITLLDYLPLTSLNVSNNNFTFAGLPLPGTVESYTYAPQKEISIPEKAPVISLYTFLEASDKTRTAYTWHMADNNAVVTDGNIRENEGRFFFDNPELGTIYCTLTNPAFPDFAGANAMRTTNVTTAPMPTHIFATMTAAEDSECSLSFAGANNGTTVYVDWTGEGDFEQLVLKETYQLFSGNLSKGMQAKFYSYDEDEGMRVFSVSSGALSAVDASPMKNLKMFALYGAEIGNENLVMPQSPAMTELSLVSTALTSADFLKDYTAITSLNLIGNNIEHLDVSMLPALEFLSAGNSAISSVVLDNPALYSADFTANNIEKIDLTKVPSLAQLILSGNSLSEINVDNLPALRALYLDGNKFTFATLPEVKSSYYIYNYSNQAQIEIELVDGKVDLSSQANINGVETEYKWFIDSPYLDEEGNIVGEELYIDQEYTLENGVTTFLNNFNNVICLMTNSLFPNLYQLSTFIDVRVNGVENVKADNDIVITAANGTVSVNAPEGTPVNVFNTAGVCLRRNQGTCSFTLAPGMYIVTAGDKTAKVALR